MSKQQHRQSSENGWVTVTFCIMEKFKSKDSRKK